MSIRLNNLGQAKTITWGVLGKRKTYKNEVFKAMEEMEKTEKFDFQSKLLPWSGMKKGRLTVMMPLKSTSPTPPPPETAIWNETTTLWNSTTDTWNTI